MNLDELFIGSKVDVPNFCPYIKESSKCEQTIKQICYENYKECIVYQKLVKENDSKE